MTVRRSDGAVETFPVDWTNSEWTISTFGGYALEPELSYTVELRARNAAGASDPLVLGAVQTVSVRYTTQIEGVDDGGNVLGSIYAAGVTTNSGVFADSKCMRLTTTAVLGESLVFRQDNQFHVAMSELCHDGTHITRNVVRPDQHLCLDDSIFPGRLRESETAVLLTPDYRSPTASVGLEHEYAAAPVDEQHLVYLCSLDGEISYQDSEGFNGKINLGDGHNIRHEIKVRNGAFAWERFATPTD